MNYEELHERVTECSRCGNKVVRYYGTVDPVCPSCRIAERVKSKRAQIFFRAVKALLFSRDGWEQGWKGCKADAEVRQHIILRLNEMKKLSAAVRRNRAFGTFLGYIPVKLRELLGFSEWTEGMWHVRYVIKVQKKGTRRFENYLQGREMHRQYLTAIELAESKALRILPQGRDRRLLTQSPPSCKIIIKRPTWVLKKG